MIYLDFETRSTIPIKLGLAKYFQEAEFLCLAYAVNDNPVELIVSRETFPEDLKRRIESGEPVSGFNVLFEYYCFRIFFPDIKIKLSQLRDTMAQAAQCNIPQNLGDALIHMGLSQEKDPRGKYLIQHLCVPRRPSKYNPSIWFEEPELYQELFDYCKQDVRAERQLSQTLPELTDYEQSLWLLTQEINLRGVPVDLRLLHHVNNMLEENRAILIAESQALLGFSVTQTAKLKEFLGTENVQADTLRDYKTTDPVKARAVEIRQELSSTAVSKYKKIKSIVASDGTIKNTLVYAGAGSSHRFASRGGLNVQNFARPPLKTPQEELIADVMDLELDDIINKYGSLVKVATSIVRGVIYHPDGLLDGDFSSIENRVASWIVDDWDTLEDFRKGLDQYKVMATDMYDVTYDDVTPDQRQIAKSAVLGCFAEGTLVSTTEGLKPIETITKDDLIWDGLTYVKSEGVVDKGLKDTVYYRGVWATLDHKYLVGEDIWKPLSHVRRNTLLDLSVTNLEIGQQSQRLEGYVTVVKSREQGGRINTIVDALVVLKNLLIELISKEENLSIATSAMAVGVKPRGLVLDWVLDLKNTIGLPTRGMLQEVDAIIKRILLIKDTGVEVLDSDSIQWRIMYATLLRLMAGVTQISKSIELIIMDTMRLAIFDSPQGESNVETRKFITYDILNCGPRNSFIVVGDTLQESIVHNCGFGQGAKGFVKFAAGYGVTITEAESQAIVNAYRTKYHKIAGAWNKFGGKAMTCVHTGDKVIVNQHISFELKDDFLLMNLPCGTSLYYYKPLLEMRQDPWGRSAPSLTAIVMNTYTRKYERSLILGSLLFQNSVQSVASHFLKYSMLKMREAGVKILMTVHDEILAEKGDMSEAKFHELLCSVPPWAEGFPLASDGYASTRFQK